MSVAESFIKTLVKTIDVPKLLEHEKIAEFLTMIREIKADFTALREISERNAERLDKIEARLNAAPLPKPDNHSQS